MQKELLKKQGEPHRLMRPQFQEFIEYNLMTSLETQKRVQILQDVKSTLAARFPDIPLTVDDISLATAGILVRQAPFELSIVDAAKGCTSTPKTTTKSSSMYSLGDVYGCIKERWPEAACVGGTDISVETMLPPARIITNDFILYFPSPLHRRRLELLKQYIRTYPELRSLMAMVFLIHHCGKVYVHHATAMAYFILTFFVETFHIPSPFDGEDRAKVLSIKSLSKGDGRTRGKPVKETIASTLPPSPTSETQMLVRGSWAKGLGQEALIDTKFDIPERVPIVMQSELYEPMFFQLRLVSKYMNWARDFNRQFYVCVPAAGRAGRHAELHLRRNATFDKPESTMAIRAQEAELIRDGKLDPEATPQHLRTWDWNAAPLVVQDPFWPINNLAAGTTLKEFGRMKQMYTLFTSQVMLGTRFSEILASILRPDVEPPSFPHESLVSKLSILESPSKSRQMNPAERDKRPVGLPLSGDLMSSPPKDSSSLMVSPRQSRSTCVESKPTVERLKRSRSPESIPPSDIVSTANPLARLINSRRRVMWSSTKEQEDAEISSESSQVEDVVEEYNPLKNIERRLEITRSSDPGREGSS